MAGLCFHVRQRRVQRQEDAALERLAAAWEDLLVNVLYPAEGVVDRFLGLSVRRRCCRAQTKQRS